LGCGTHNAIAALLAAASALAACQRAPRSIVVAVRPDLELLDPHARDAMINISVLFNVYEALVATDAEMRLRPGLALRWENPDPTTWVFRLRPHVRFHDGRPLRAADVVYSLRRAMAPELEMKGYLRDVVRLRALDELAVEVATESPDRALLNRMAFVAIVPEGSDSASLEAHPTGTGPFRFAEWRKGSSLRLRRNEGYWGPRPALREVQFDFGVPPDGALAGLRAGRYQLCHGDARRFRPAFAGGERYRVLRAAGLLVVMLHYDLARDVTPFCRAKRNPFKDPRVRRALDLALDRTRIVESLAGDALPAWQAVPRSVFGFSPAIPERGSDAAQARRLLARAGYPRGFGVVLHARGFYEDAAQAVREQLRAIGVDVEVRLLSNSAYFDAVHRRELSFWVGAFACTTGDASELLGELVHSHQPERRLGNRNLGGYADLELDRAIEAGAAIQDPQARRAALERVMQDVAERRVLLPLYVPQDGYALDAGLAWAPRSDSFIRAAEIELAR
jgi:peptide/nickel transport system substrate-binding protein